MKILVLGSINIDYNYYVGHITTPKETQGASHMEVFPGGQGIESGCHAGSRRSGGTARRSDWIGWTGNVGQAQGAAVH